MVTTHFNSHVVEHEDVLRLDIFVHDLSAVQHAETLNDCSGDSNDLILFDDALLLLCLLDHPRVQVAVRCVLHD